MIDLFFKYFISFQLFVQGQYNFNLHFELHFPNLTNYPCPQYHVYALSLFPHTCVSMPTNNFKGYHSECLGVTEVEVRKFIEDEEVQLLCHPNFQVNFASTGRLHKNFYVDPQTTISLSIDSNNKFLYSQDIYLPNCFILYTWYTSTNEKSQHCLYYHSAYSLGNKPFADFTLTGAFKDYYSYGGYDEFTAIQCPNIYCDGCSYSSDLTSYNCTSCFDDRYIYADIRDCSLECPIPGGLCDEQNPIPTKCKPGYKKVMIDETSFRCDICQDRKCLNCDDDQAPCSECKMKLWNKKYFSMATIVNSYNMCHDLDNCIEYQPLTYNATAYNQKCLQAIIGYVVKDPINIKPCKSFTNMTNCYHCTNTTSCLVCNVGYYLNNTLCVQQTPCSSACKTCLADNANYCTSCYGEKLLQVGVCICENICLTCSTYHNCLSCKPEQLRHLDGTKCVCNAGYYDGGDVNFLCYKCHPACLTCDGGSASNCITCDSQQNRHIVKGQCICDLGFGETDLNYSNLVCQTCHPRCKFCIMANDPLSCTACLSQQSRQLTINLDCQCQDSHGDDGGTLDVCYSCHYSCSSCEGILSTNCLTCDQSTHRQFINNTCICLKGYYESTFGLTTCPSCHYSCVDCLNDSSSDQCTECPPSRKPDGSGTTFSCVCKDINYYDDEISSECKQCHYTCLSCTSFGSSFCSSCDLTIRKLSNQKCPCLPKKYDDGISTCLLCHQSCLTCQGQLITDCLTCSSDVEFRQLKTGQCICLDGYFEDNNQIICSKCSYRCKICAIKKDQCLTCVDNSFRDLGSDSSCSCSIGYFDIDGNGICQTCNKKCNRCSGPEENQCIDCKALVKRQLSNNRCLCISHYFEQNLEQCTVCSSNCLECQSSYDNCTSCDSDKVLVGNTCQCATKLLGSPISTYQAIGQPQCIKCHYSCLTCNGITNSKCIDCYPMENRYVSGTKCLCNDGFFDAGVAQCQQCGYQCLTCVTSQNQCLSCQFNSLRTLNSQIKACICLKGYYDDGSNPICQKCDYTCSTCSVQQNHCLTCLVDSNRQFNQQLFSCDCVAGYYESGEIACKSCHYSCYECIGPSNQQCKSCKSFDPNSKRVAFNDKCICLTGYYDDGISSNCQPCAITCEDCENSAKNCTACSITRIYSNSTCECISGYYEKGQMECSKCNQNCVQCQTTATTCIACDSTKYRMLNQLTKSCVCLSNYLELNGDCYQCNVSCLTCTITINNCSSCEPIRFLSNGQCLCQNGYFENQGVCQSCDQSCLTCQDSAKFCLTCSLLIYRKLTINNTCECINGYFEQSTTSLCEKCDSSCKTCLSNSSNCTSCESILNLVLLVNQCICKSGYYLDTVSKKCLKCHISCLTCTLYQQCTSCLENTRVFNSNLNTCKCQQGYFEANLADCQKCNYQCQTCEITQDTCLSCHPLANRQLNGNKCQCQQGFFDAGIEICIACAGICKACKDRSTNCTLCYDQEQLRFLLANACKCQPGYFDNGTNICQKCSLKCKTCAGSSDYCTSCDTDQRLDHSIIHKCPCIQGFYDDEQSVCQKCHVKCEGCLNSKDNCLSCKSSPNSNRFLLADQCNCKPGYFDDNVQVECQKCSKKCSTCVGNPLNCLACYNNLRIVPPTCKCLDGYYEDETLFCMKCSSKCLTCETDSSNCLSCQIERINKTCDCKPGFFDAGLENCLKCGFQCLECTQQYINCTSCRGDRLSLPYCNCPDGYYDDGVQDTCQPCDYRCATCNIEGCLTCSGNRVLTSENACNPPENSIFYDTTYWCSSCDVAVVIVRFSDDLNFILIKFEFQLKQIQQVKRCSDILNSDTLSKLGIGYSCDIDEVDATILKISLGQESSIIVGDQISLQSNVLQHLDCQKKIITFVFTNVKKPINLLEPKITFKIQNLKINSCTNNNIYSNSTQNDGKRQFATVNWSYQILNSGNDTILDNFMKTLNKQQSVDLIIPAKTLPENSTINFSIGLKNFLGTQSMTSFTLYTQFDSQPVIQIDIKNSYYIYEDINIAFTVSIKNCRGKNVVVASLFQINLVETEKSIKTARSSNMNYSVRSDNSTYSAIIPKHKLSAGVAYSFNLSVTDVNSQQSSYSEFQFEIKMAELMCQFENALTIYDCQKDVVLHIQCKDLNSEVDWNEDPDLKIQVSCIDLYTSQYCRNKKNQKLEIFPNEYYQTVPKNSMKPFSAQSWSVIATKGNLTKSIQRVIIYLEDNFLPLSIKYDASYSVRSLNNYELLDFTYDIPQENRSSVVEMSMEIIQDFVVLSLTQPKYYEYQFVFQEQIGSLPIVSMNYSFRFSVQYSTNINPGYFNLPVNLNIPPICSKISKLQLSNLSLTQLEITPTCSKSEDQPYQYKFAYFLSETDMQGYLSGDKNLILGETAYQLSPQLTQLVPNSFLNQAILFQVSILDQGGSITNMYGKTEIENNFNCTLLNDQNSTDFTPDIIFSQFIQALGQAGQDCIQLKESKLQQLYSKIDFQSQELNILLKALKISKKYQANSQSGKRRVLDEQSYQQCYDQEKGSFSINYTINASIESNSSLQLIKGEIKNFQAALSFLNVQHDDLKLQLQNQTSQWDQKLSEEFDQIQACLLQLYLLADKIVLQFSKLSSIDEQLYSNFIALLKLLDKLSLLVQESIKINGDRVSLTGDMITWEFLRSTKEALLGFSGDLEEEIIKFSQKEQITIKLNPVKFSNQTMESIKKQFNLTTIIIDPEIMIQTKLKNFLINGRQVAQNNVDETYNINLKQISKCDNQSEQYQQTDQKPICVIAQQNGSISQCSTNIVYLQQDKKALINCKCKEFGYIFIIYFQELKNNTNNTVSNGEEPIDDSPFFSINIQSASFYCFIAYIGTFSSILLLIIFYENKQQYKQVEEIQEHSEQENIKLQIKIYPGNYKIIKENFKYLHQLSKFCYFNGLLIKRSFYFLDINVQFCFMLLIIYLIDFELDQGKYLQIIETIFVVTFGVIYRFLSKVLQGFARINNTLKIITYVLLELILIMECLTIIARLNTENSQKNEKRIMNWLIGLVIYETQAELILIIFSVFTYKLIFKSIQFKEFIVFNHLVYYFAYQERLEKIFQQIIVL